MNMINNTAHTVVKHMVRVSEGAMRGVFYDMFRAEGKRKKAIGSSYFGGSSSSRSEVSKSVFSSA